MTQEPDVVWAVIQVALFVMGIVMLWRLGAWYNEWKRSSEIPKNMEAARDEFAAIMSERLGLAMRSAELDAVIVEKWNDWPIEYRPSLYMVLRHTQLLEETLYLEAVEQGIYPKRLFEGDLMPPAPVPPGGGDGDGDQQLPVSAISAPEPIAEVVDINRGRAMFAWIGGQITRIAG